MSLAAAVATTDHALRGTGSQEESTEHLIKKFHNWMHITLIIFKATGVLAHRAAYLGAATQAGVEFDITLCP